DAMPIRGRLEAPMIVEIPERSLDILDVDTNLRHQRHLGAEALPEHLEGHNQVGEKYVPVPAGDPCRLAPRQEFRVAVDASHQVVELLRAVGQMALLGVRRHGRQKAQAAGFAEASCDSRAVRSRAKSSPAW